MPTVDGAPLVSAELSEPLVGVWCADVVADAANISSLAGQVTIDIDGVEWVGTVLPGSSDVYGGRCEARIVGGANALSSTVTARAHTSISLDVLFRDLMSECGETVSDDYDSSELNLTLQRWVRPAEKASMALSAIATAIGLVWRVKRDGTVWIGTDSYDDIDTATAKLVDKSPGDRTVTLAPATPVAEPGMSYQGAHIGYVATSLHGGLRQQLWLMS